MDEGALADANKAEAAPIESLTLGMLEGECPYVSLPTIKIQLECRSNRSPLGDLEVCSAIKPFFYYFS